MLRLFRADRRIISTSRRLTSSSVATDLSQMVSRTSVFTQQAEDQANAPGYKPIDLIDGERLLELLQHHDVGIKHVTLVDREFFKPFT